MASGDTLCKWMPQAAEPDPTPTGAADTRNGHPIYRLALTENVRLSDIMPQHYAGGGVEFYIKYGMSSAAADDVKVETDMERLEGTTDMDVDGFTGSPQNSGDQTVPAAAGRILTLETAHTSGAQMDSVVVGDMFRVNIERVAVVGTDAGGDLEIRGVEMREA